MATTRASKLAVRAAALVLATARAQVGVPPSLQTCCAEPLLQLQPDVELHSSVAPNTYADFYYVADTLGVNLAFEVTAESSNPAAIGVYVFDSMRMDDGDDTLMTEVPLQDRCVLCDGTPSQPITNVSIMALSTLRPANAAPADGFAVDMDRVSHIYNATHRKFFVYVGECYQMAGSVYYLSVFGESPSTVTFSVKVTRVSAALPVAIGADGPSIAGSVCDGKYLHYYVDWPHVTAGGMQMTVRKTSGELSSFFMRKEKCAGAKGENLFGPISLSGYGLSQGAVLLPSAGHVPEVGRYYISVRGSVDLCGDFAIQVRNLTTHEYHAIVSAAS